MHAASKSDSTPTRNHTVAERTSDREVTVTRTFNAPARLVFEAWTTPELIQRWWAPRSIGISFVSCEVDARTGGRYRFVFSHPASPDPMAFFGRYLEVTPPSRLVWTNEEAGDNGQVTTVTFEEQEGKTLVVMRDLYPSKRALDDTIASGSASDMSESFDQFDELLPALKESGKGV